jgi:hypothetical protein
MPATRIRLCRSNPSQSAHPVDPAAGAPRTGCGSLANATGTSPGVSVEPAAPKRRGGVLLSRDGAHQGEYAATLTAGHVWSVMAIGAVIFTALTELPIRWLAIAFEGLR